MYNIKWISKHATQGEKNCYIKMNSIHLELGKQFS
jgi:hypothetical protein